MTIKIILKNGVTIPVKCDNFTLHTNGFGAATGYTIEGIEENKPVYVNFGDSVNTIAFAFTPHNNDSSDYRGKKTCVIAPTDRDAFSLNSTGRSPT